MQITDIFETPERQINWVPAYPRLVDDGEDTVVWIDVETFDASFQKDRNFYVGPGGADGIGDRYVQFGLWLEQGLPVKMPEVGFNWRGEVSFGNGRHRYAWMRDHGAKAIPVTVATEEADEFRKKFGSALRATVLR